MNEVMIGVIVAIVVEAAAIIFWSGKQYEYNKNTREQVVSLKGDVKELQLAINNHLSGIDTNMKTMTTDMAIIRQVVQDLPCKNHADSIKDLCDRASHQEGLEEGRER